MGPAPGPRPAIHSGPATATQSAHSTRHRSQLFPHLAGIHPPYVKQQALDLIAAGLNDCEVSRRLGVPRSTVRDWRRPTYVPRDPLLPRSPCPRCWRNAKPMRFTPEDYSELLAMYLGDGCIATHPRTQRLRISLDTKYPNIIADACSLLRRCFPHNRVDVVAFHDGACVNVSLYSAHLVCLLPQHGRGVKHRRRIVLEPWQATIVDAAPWPFIRGCIRTDGCCFINRTGPYEYVTYEFSNMSEDIVRLFVRACDLTGVATRLNQSRRTGRWDVRINRRESVALMLDHVGTKT
jgi:hypothetical protein